jgi:hypothetical protein
MSRLAAIHRTDPVDPSIGSTERVPYTVPFRPIYIFWEKSGKKFPEKFPKNSGENP